DKVRPMHVEGWIVGLRAKGHSESTVRSAYTILRAILDTAVRDGALARNPAAAVKRPKVTAKESVFLTPEQVRTLLEAAKSRPVRAAVQTARQQPACGAARRSRCGGRTSTL